MNNPCRPSLRSCARPPACAGATQRGVAAVEFALLLPVLLLLVVGVIDISFALYNKAVITQASREAARAGIVLATPRASDADLSGLVTQHTQAVLMDPNTPGQLSTVVDRSDPTRIKVTVNYTYTGLLLGSLIGRTDNGWALSGSTVMLYE